MNWDIFLAPYTQTVDELKIKLKGMRKQFDYESRHSPIEFVTGRVKPITSIIEKRSAWNTTFENGRGSTRYRRASRSLSFR